MYCHVTHVQICCRLAHISHARLNPFPFQVLLDAGMGQSLPNAATSQLISACQDPNTQLQWCVKLVETVMIGAQPQFDPKDFVRVAATWPSSVGARNLLHW